MSDQKPDRPEQAEWEVIDSAGPQQPKAGRTATLRALLGPWWRWKIGLVVLALAILAAVVFAVAGVMFVVGIVAVAVSLLVAKVRQLMRQSGSSLTR